MQKKRKDEINHLVDVWIRSLLSVSNDAGWEGRAPIAMLIDYGTAVYTCNDQSNVAMISAIRLLRESHHEFKKINFAITEVLTDKPNSALAVVAKIYFSGVNKETDRAWTDKERAAKVGQSYTEFRYNLDLGLELLDKELDKFDRVMEAC